MKTRQFSIIKKKRAFAKYKMPNKAKYIIASFWVIYFIVLYLTLSLLVF